MRSNGAYPVERLGALIEDDRETTKPAKQPVLVAPVAAVEESVETEVIEAINEQEPARTVTPEPANDRQPVEPEASSQNGSAAPDAGIADADASDLTPPLPDDPGVPPDEAAKPRKRFSLF